MPSTYGAEGPEDEVRAAEAAMADAIIQGDVATIASPETILRWHRELVARKWDDSHRRRMVGRPQVRPEIVELILRFAQENPSWGYDRVQGSLGNVGLLISDSTVANIFNQHVLEPGP